MPIRLLITLLACVAVLPAADSEYAPLVARLGDEDPAARETARQALVAHGSPALPDLRAALETAKAEAHRAAIRDVIAAIAKREPHGIRFEARLPKLRIGLDEVNADAFRYTIRLRNGGEKPVVLWPYFSLRVLDDKGRAVAPSLRQGRWGLGRSKRYLERVGFIEIKPGETHVTTEALSRYMHDFALILGWKLPGPGEYTLEFTYDFDRTAVKKGCDPAWKALDDPAQPWNRAVEAKHVFTAKLKVSARDAK
jgi:hypothetical protein